MSCGPQHSQVFWSYTWEGDPTESKQENLTRVSVITFDPGHRISYIIACASNDDSDRPAHSKEIICMKSQSLFSGENKKIRLLVARYSSAQFAQRLVNAN